MAILIIFWKNLPFSVGLSILFHSRHRLLSRRLMQGLRQILQQSSVKFYPSWTTFQRFTQFFRINFTWHNMWAIWQIYKVFFFLVSLSALWPFRNYLCIFDLKNFSSVSYLHKHLLLFRLCYHSILGIFLNQWKSLHRPFWVRIFIWSSLRHHRSCAIFPHWWCCCSSPCKAYTLNGRYCLPFTRISMDSISHRRLFGLSSSRANDR